MADIFDFPQGAHNVAYANGKRTVADDEVRCSSLSRPRGVPDQVWNAVLSVERMQRLDGVTYREIPVPNSMANFGIGVEMECGDARTSGWIMVLYSLKFRDDWQSHWRCVAFASLPMSEKKADCLTPGMYWDSMMEYLDSNDSEHVLGTVTVAQNTAFGHRPNIYKGGCEIRVSWTPLDYPGGGFDAGSQIGQWATFLLSMMRAEEENPVD